MKKKILIIEDDPLILEATFEFLKEESFDVSTAVNGLEGIERAIEIIPDLIISDISMPYKNGHDVYKTLQSIPKTSKIPFIFFTANVQKDNLQIGTDDYLLKPFRYSDLLESIRIGLEKNDCYLKQR